MFGDPEKKKNPTKAYFEFKSSQKGFFSYNKETKKSIALPLPARFIVLDELHTVSGFVESVGSGSYSNEVRDLKTQPLKIKTFKPGFEINGLWDDVKAECKSHGIKYAKSLYCLYTNGKDYRLINIKLEGGANNVWIDSANGYKKDDGTRVPPKFNTKQHVIVIKDEFEERKKGSNVYSVPVFDYAEINDEFREEAIRVVNEELRPFLDEYLNESGE